jgi:hypothetical protein
MKYGKLKTLIIAAAAGILMVPVGGVQAATNTEIVNMNLSDFYGFSWDGTAASKYKQPTDINDAPGFVPFNDVFTTDMFKPVVADTESASSSSVLTNSKGEDVGVEITKNDAATQSGSIWSTSGNELDLTKDFHATMQFYLGKEGKTPSGDGIAFVMTKQAPVVKAKNGNPSPLPGGGALGIWGDLQNFTSEGAANSFAVAIDTNANDDYKWDTAVYNKVKYNASGEAANVDNYTLSEHANSEQNYIAWGYPGMKNQYRKVAHVTYDASNMSTLEHNKMLAFSGEGRTYQEVDGSTTGEGEFDLVPKGALNNGAWHQMDIDYVRTSDGGKFTYTVTLKNVDGTDSGTKVTRSINWSDVDIQNIFGTTKVQWGFTGATGTNFENGVVSFQNIPGLLDNKLESGVLGSDGKLANTVYAGDQDTQVFSITYNGDNSKQSWPKATDGTLSAILNTGSNYGFVVNGDFSNPEIMSVPITVNSKTAKYTLRGVPIIPHYVDLPDGSRVIVANQIRVQGIKRFDQAQSVKDDARSQNLSVPVVAYQLGAQETISAGTVGGDNGLINGTVDMPEVKERPLSLDAVPTFEFPSLTVAQVIGGIKGLSNTTANATALKTNGLKMQLPQNAQFELTAALDSFNLGADYVAGSSNIQFDYAKGDASGTQTVTLKDDGTATPIYTGTKDPNSSAVTNVKLNMLPYPKIKAGNYGHSNNITWTLSATPTSAPAR